MKGAEENQRGRETGIRDPKPLVIHLASGNAHKAAEFQRLADESPARSTSSGPRACRGASRLLQICVVPARVMPEVVEDAGTFVGNARKKAAALRAALPPGAWVLADDSGVCVDALDGAPGVESAYFAGPGHDAAANLRKLAEVMRAVPDGQRAARFVCVLLLLAPDGKEQVFEGRCEGVLAREPAGGQGFGYDPLFIPAGFDRTYAQITEAEKNRISHRGRAWRRLAEWLGSR